MLFCCLLFYHLSTNIKGDHWNGLFLLVCRSINAMRGYYVSTRPSAVQVWSFWNFAVCFVHGLKMCMWLIIRKYLEDYKSVKLLRFRTAQAFSWSEILSVLILVQAVCNSSREVATSKNRILFFKTLKFKNREPKYIQIWRLNNCDN